MESIIRIRLFVYDGDSRYFFFSLFFSSKRNAVEKECSRQFQGSFYRGIPETLSVYMRLLNSRITMDFE